MPTEKELLERIRQLEEQNGVLQDKLDMIWSVLADEYETAAAEDEEAAPPNLVQIDRRGHGASTASSPPPEKAG